MQASIAQIGFDCRIHSLQDSDEREIIVDGGGRGRSSGSRTTSRSPFYGDDYR